MTPFLAPRKYHYMYYETIQYCSKFSKSGRNRLNQIQICLKRIKIVLINRLEIFRIGSKLFGCLRFCTRVFLFFTRNDRFCANVTEKKQIQNNCYRKQFSSRIDYNGNDNFH